MPSTVSVVYGNKPISICFYHLIHGMADTPCIIAVCSGILQDFHGADIHYQRHILLVMDFSTVWSPIITFICSMKN